MDLTICELFAGVGGFRVGFEKNSSDWKTVWANQWEPSRITQYAFDCYNSHYNDKGGINEYSNIDITQVPSDKIPDHTVLVGGFPCQDYSVASTGAKGITGKKGVLWWQIERIVEEKKPPFLLLENVDRLLKSPAVQRGRDFGIIIACLQRLGYYVEWRVINAADYGFQQKRRRVFIFAARSNTKYYKNIVINSKFNFTECFFSKIFNIDKVEDEISTINITVNSTDDIAQISNSFKFEFKNSGYCLNNIIYTTESSTKKLLQNPPFVLKDILENNVIDRNYFILSKDLDKWIYMKGAKAIERTSKSGHKYMFREGAISFPDSLDKPARTMLTSEGSKNRSTHVIKDPNTLELRLLTPVECERINGFPENWTNTGMPNSYRYFCMGNALVVNLITYMAEYLKKIIEKED